MVTTNNIAITAPPGLVSIIIACCGMLDYTKQCVPSVLRHSREPFELMLLDIGSLDAPPNTSPACAMDCTTACALKSAAGLHR